MIQSPIGKLARQTKRASDFVRWNLLGSEIESVYFYTLHKCASSLFAGFVLPNALGLRHVHFARQIHRHLQDIDLSFEDTGHIYGPIRVSADRNSTVYDRFVSHVIQSEFVKDKNAIFFVRDPRDILVSAYYSFGFHHKLSPDECARQQQLAARSKLQSMSIDEYALSNVNFFRNSFELISTLNKASRTGAILKYEQMISDFDSFATKLSQLVRLKPAVVRHTFKVSRPKASEKGTHRRSGQPNAFSNKLQPETIDRLNLVLGDVLDEFEYER